MLYRKLGRSGFNVSILGFGAMRLPIQGGVQSPADRFNPDKLVDEEKTIKMIEYAIGQGVNYFDTAYVYHGGKSEHALGKALKRCRNRVMLATKLPLMQAAKREDFDRFLDEQLKRLDTNYLDVYLLHGLNRQNWGKMKGLGVLKFLDQIQADGRARYVGFSFHDDVRIFKEIVDSYDWMLCQTQYNYYDEHYQAGREGLVYAVCKGLGVVVMEPLRGGKLADPIPENIKAIWDSAEVKRTPAEWGLRWVWNHPEVSVVLSGMSSMSQVMENVKLANDGEPSSLLREELSIIDQVKETYKKMLKIDCTGCAYCMPCKTGVNIPANFSVYNDMFVFRTAPEVSAVVYNLLLSPEQKASNCAECGECEEKCPQHIKIKDELKAVHEALFRETLQKK
jgi:predicted aldo/keto reductase-like oxidoreductase